MHGAPPCSQMASAAEVVDAAPPEGAPPAALPPGAGSFANSRAAVQSSALLKAWSIFPANSEISLILSAESSPESFACCARLTMFFACLRASARALLNAFFKSGSGVPELGHAPKSGSCLTLLNTGLSCANIRDVHDR